jgi:hypothetical protein
MKAQPRWLNKLAVEENAKMRSLVKLDGKSSSAADRALQMSNSLKARYQPWIDQVSFLSRISLSVLTFSYGCSVQ